MYRACKDNHAPRSVKEVARIFDVEEQVLMKGNRCFDNLTRENNDDDDDDQPLVRPTHFVTRFSRHLGLSTHVVEDILKVSSLVETKGILADCVPVSIAASVIFLVGQMHSLTLKKSEISEVAQISVVTINNCFKKLKYYKEYIDQEIQHMGMINDDLSGP
jgi:transcription initiation factor TFIIIB Brf1 subunit/transcription initiation factor TFIIB